MRKLPRELWIGLRITLLIAVLCGLVYPLAMTGIAQAAFSHQANGSLITDSGGHVVGSSLIGQCYYRTSTDPQGNVTYQTVKDSKGNDLYFVVDPRYFQSRPLWVFITSSSGTATLRQPACDPSNSTGSNLGPSNPTLVNAVKAYTDYLHKLGVAKNADGSNAPMPVDLVTGDFTGFDPDISEAAALAQVQMVVGARHLDAGRLRQVAEDHVQGRMLGIFGAPHINVLDLNRALEAGAAR